MSTYDPSDFTASTKLYDPEPIELQPKFMVGLTTGVEGNCLFLSDDVVVYPVSGVIVIYDTKNRSQKFIQFTEQPAKTTITAMDLNPINLVLAVATTSTEDGIKPTVSFYDLTTLELKHTFTEPEDEYPGSTERRQRFASVQFLNDNAYITALAVSDSDCVLYYYNWKNSNLDTCVRVNNPVADVAINPIDTTICCFVGKDLFRSMTRTDTGWNQYGFREAAGVDFTCVCWLCGDRCLSGTSNGWVVLMKNGQLQAVYCLDDLNWELDVTVKMTIDESLGTIVISKNKPPPDAIRICVAFQSGFVLVVGNSTIYYFQKLDEDDRPRYIKSCVFEKLSDRYLTFLETTDNLSLPHYVESAFISPNCKMLMCITKRAQIYWASLESRRLNREYVIPVRPFGEEMHYGGVGSMSTCLWKPNIMTCGLIDNTIKVWNYVECKLLFSKHYLEHVSSISIHPNGLYSVATFMDHAEYQMIQLDDLVPLKYFPIAGYNLCSFSDSGHMFALGKKNAIDVYCSIMFEKLFSCQEHFQSVDKLVWSNNNRIIVALHTTTNQQVTMFDTKTGLLLRDIYSVAAGTDLTLTEDGKKMYIISKNGKLKEIYEREAIRDVNCQQGSLNSVAITKSNLILFIAAQNGIVLAIVLPILYDDIVEYKKYKMHNHSVTKLCLAMDGSTLISCSEDGSLCIWEVKDANTINKINFDYFDDILANGKKLDEINENIEQIKVTVKKLETKSTLTVNAIKKMKEQEIQNTKHTHLDHFNDIVELNKGIVKIQKNVINNLKQKLHVVKDQNENSIVNLESKYCNELTYKFEKHLNLENELYSITSTLKKFSETLLKKLNEELQEVLNKQKKKIKEKDEGNLKCQEILINEKTGFKTLLKDTENDVDENVFETKNKFINELKNKKEIYLNTMSKLEKYKMKYNGCLATTADFRHTAEVFSNDLEELNQLTRNKNNRIFDLTVTLKCCNELIPQKEEKIQVVRQNVNELEKKLIVLKASITELQHIYNPLVLRIQEKQNLIEQLGIEYNDKIKIKNKLEILLNGLSVKNIECERELDEQKRIVQNGSISIKQLKIDMSLASQHYTNNNENTKAILDFFIKYAFSESEEVRLKEELECKIEFSRQMKFLERSIDGFKKSLKSFENKYESYYLVMEENMRLIEEINVYRNIAKSYFTKYNNLKILSSPIIVNEIPTQNVG